MNQKDIQSTANAMNACVAAGMRAQSAMDEIRLKGLRAAYDRAKQDDQMRLPSYLMAALEKVLRP